MMLASVLLVSALAAPLSTVAQASSWTPPSADSGLPSSTLSATEQWSNLLGNALYFYDAQRSGRLDSQANSVGGIGNRVPWRNDSALNDGQDVGVDLVGGYYDAGDYLKCTYPLTFSLGSIAWGAIDFGTAYEKAGQSVYLDRMMRYGLDWLIKAHPEPSTLYVQVGLASIDNNYWGGDQDIPLPRQSFPINATSPGTDAAASAAAAFAASSMLYSGVSLATTSSAYSPPSSLVNTTYAQLLLSHAKDLYDFANTTTRQTYQTAVPAVKSVYASSGWQDEMVWGGLWMALATNNSAYYADALGLYNSAQLSPKDKVFNWDSAFPALPIVFLQIALARPSLATNAGLDANASGWQTVCEQMLDMIVNNQGRAQQTKGGLLYYNGDSDAASLNPAANAAMLLLRYAPMASSTAKGDSYTTYAQSQIDYILGDNPMSAPYVVGVNPNAPTNPHSAMASGGNNINAIDTQPPTEANVLYGAVVGGPNKKDNFYNKRSDYIQTEIALDYNAPMLTLAAQSLLRLPDKAPFYTTLAAGAYSVPPGSSGDQGGGGLSEGAKIAIAIVVIVVVLAIVFLVGWLKFGWFGRGRR